MIFRFLLVLSCFGNQVPPTTQDNDYPINMIKAITDEAGLRTALEHRSHLIAFNTAYSEQTQLD
jgi:hypothetical protein